ncbi:hypothetical protein D3P06_05530 [Paracoccus aestuarii]|uniref:Uncharacterized protein n=1 Tax=Paracoccus aestuarii TaxID=453842 RepID=A0A418ZZ96_9RHOB|nr:hypothetical protein [Paracoccus aestuarii]RJL05889.1 hypothetical protein D3P06_05530 [Paracoccus aestuarii]WCQ98566.1 hypothetical protein JHW48_11770 [Paracoccus aestuarii]
MTDMTPATRFTSRVEAVLGQSRTIRAMLLDEVVPHLPPARRSAAEHVARRLIPSRIFASETLHDLDALIAQLEQEAEAGTRTGWEADDGHSRGGWTTIWRDERAASLTASAAELRRFRMSITTVIDALEAERIANRLMDAE